MEELRIRLKKAMDIRNLSQIELSEKTRIPKSSINQYLSGYSKPKDDRIFLLSKALDVAEAWLMGFDIPMKREQTKEKNQETQRLDNLSGFSNETEDYRWIARKAKSLTPEQQKKLKNVIASIFDEEDDDEE